MKKTDNKSKQTTKSTKSNTKLTKNLDDKKPPKTTSNSINKSTEQNKKQAEDYLKQDLQNFENYVNNKSYVPQTINQNQFDALVSFAFNLGQGNLKELCTANYPPGQKTVAHIADEITLYNKVNKKYNQGLANRRAKEKQLFLGQI